MSHNRVFPPRRIPLHIIGIRSFKKKEGKGSSKKKRRRYTEHHLVPTTRVDEFFNGNYVESENTIVLPANWHSALHAVIDNLVLEEIVIFFSILYSKPGKHWDERSLLNLINEVKEGRYVLADEISVIDVRKSLSIVNF